jgi:hypothetical protein
LPLSLHSPWACSKINSVSCFASFFADFETCLRTSNVNLTD